MKIYFFIPVLGSQQNSRKYRGLYTLLPTHVQPPQLWVLPNMYILSCESSLPIVHEQPQLWISPLQICYSWPACGDTWLPPKALDLLWISWLLLCIPQVVANASWHEFILISNTILNGHITNLSNLFIDSLALSCLLQITIIENISHYYNWKFPPPHFFCSL